MQSDNSANLPVSNNSVQDWAHVVAELLTAAHRKLVSNVAAEDMGLVKETRSPVSTAVIRVLPARLPTRTRCTGAPPTRTEVAGRIAQTLGVGISDLRLQAVTHTFLQHGLKSIVALAGIGHICSGDGINATQSRIIRSIQRTRSSTSKVRTCNSGNNGFSRFRNRTCRIQSFQLRGLKEIQQMGAVLADVAYLRGQAIAELMLNGKVPLLVHCRPYVLISDPDPDSRITSKVDPRARSRRG